MNLYLRIGLAVLGTLVVAGILYLHSKRVREIPIPTFKTTEELIAYLAEEARDIAQNNYQTSLDYSPQSIQKVEEILGKLHQDYQRNPEIPGVKGIASAFGAYVGEAIRRANTGAKWERDHPKLGERTYPLHWAGGESFPMAWCFQRITQGPEDNVWNKYLLLKEAFKAQGAK